MALRLRLLQTIVYRSLITWLEFERETVGWFGIRAARRMESVM